MLNLCFTDIERVKYTLNTLYDADHVTKAIDSLLSWYEEEGFDNDDLTNDWIPNDYKNCHGIDIVVDKLNHAGNYLKDSDKKILFHWFCHWLLPKVPEPMEALISQSLTPIIETFRIMLQDAIPQFKSQPYLSNNVSQTFAEICQEEQYTKVEELKDDLETHDDSYIMEEIIDRYPQYNHIRYRIFNVLQSIVFGASSNHTIYRQMLLMEGFIRDIGRKLSQIIPTVINEICFNYFYKSLDLKNLDLNISTEVLSLTDQICSNEYPNLYGYSAKAKAPIYSKVITAKALDFQNEYPLLLSLMDAFSRYCVQQNCKGWKENISPKFLYREWFERINGFCRYIAKKDQHIAETIKCAIETLHAKCMGWFDYEHRWVPTIYDSYEIYAKYAIAMNKFILQISNTNNEPYPIQVDFWVIPRLVKNCQRIMYMYSKEIDSVRFDDGDDDDEDDIYMYDDEDTEYKDNDRYKIQCLGMRNETEDDEETLIWNLEDLLMNEGYKQNVDYFVCDNKETYDIDKMEENLNQLWNKNIGWKHNLYQRYIIIADRRNPVHIKTKKMIDDTDKDQTWNDRMYLILPKQANRISREYEFKLSECFLSNTREYLLPTQSLCNKNFGGFDSGNGYKFVLSYHICLSNKIKTYWYLKNGAIRFDMNDINLLWPRYFKPMENENASGSFQSLSNNDVQILMKELCTKFRLKDDEFDAFCAKLKTFH